MLKKQVMLCFFVSISISLLTQRTFAIALRDKRNVQEPIPTIEAHWDWIKTTKLPAPIVRFGRSVPKIKTTKNNSIKQSKFFEKTDDDTNFTKIYNVIAERRPSVLDTPRVRFGRSVPETKTAKKSTSVARAPIIRFG